MTRFITVRIAGKVTSAKVPAAWLKHYQIVGYTGRANAPVYEALCSHPFYAWYAGQK